MYESQVYNGVKVFLGVVGIVLFGFVALTTVPTLIFMASAKPADGVVVGNNVHEYEEGSSRGSFRWSWLQPVVEVSVNGRPYTFEGRNGPPGWREYAVGESVPVAYDPADPFDVRIASFGALYGTPLILGILGLTSTTGSAVMFVKRQRSQRQPARTDPAPTNPSAPSNEGAA